MKKRGARLFYFTASFPWGMGETWKSNELKYLVEYFDEIVVVPFTYYGNFDSPKALPAGVSAEKPLYPTYAPRVLGPEALGLLDRNAGYYLAEFVRKKPFFRRKHLAAWLTASTRLSMLLKHAVVRRIMANPSRDTSLCFFWGRDSCDFVPLVDKRKFRSVVVRFHRGDLFEDQNDGYIPYRRQLLEAASVCAPSSEKGRRHLLELYPEVRTPVRVVRLGVASPGRVAGSSDSVLRIMSCSFFKPVKRVHLIAEALRHLSVPVEWTHVGDGALMPQVRQLASTLPKNIVTRFVGNIETGRLMDFYLGQPIDVFMNVSSSEGVPMSILESLSCGVPVFATDVGGNGEVVDDTVGKLLPADVSPAVIAAALERLYALPLQQKLEMRDAAFRRYRERGDAEVLARELGELLVAAP